MDAPPPGDAPGTVDRYGGAAVALHWLTLALVVANLALGLSMVDLPFSPQKFRWYLWHKWIGITVLLATSLRLAWRAGHPPPPPVPMVAWQHQAALVSHRLMYVLLFLIPLSGWLYSSATGVQVNYLGLVTLPDLLPKDKALAGALKLVHAVANSLLAAVVCVHAAAALRHHFVDRDATLVRMLPFVTHRATPTGTR
jgi:cytochrome b561